MTGKRPANHLDNSNNDQRKRLKANSPAVGGIQTKNYYGKLANNETVLKPKTNRPAPITLLDRDISVHAIVSEAGIKNPVNTKNMTVGRKIFLENKEDKDKFLSVLKSKNVGCFTHPERNQKPSKFLLYGLPKMEKDELRDELKAVNLTPTNIFEITIKKQKWDKDALYLLHFRKEDNITLQILLKIRAVFHTIITWKPYNSNKKGPTQCRNCLSYGHGSSHCHMPSNCMFCAGQHSSAICPGKENENFINKCYNCEGNHKSSDIECPSRKAYINIKNSINNRNVSNGQRKNDRKNGSANCQHSHQPNPHEKTTSSHKPSRPVTENLSYAEAAKTNNNNERTSSNDNSNGTDLFSAKELMNIFSEITSRMVSCHTKQDQISLLFDISAKYVC